MNDRVRTLHGPKQRLSISKITLDAHCVRTMGRRILVVQPQQIFAIERLGESSPNPAGRACNEDCAFHFGS
jgi:hypothetical protein